MSASPSIVLGELFGNNRAEFPPNRFNELFVTPRYFSTLEEDRPTILVGGRGTGKTTTLRSLRFDTTYQRTVAAGLPFDSQRYLGVFTRMNKNRVHAFQGAALPTDLWSKAFSHYFNLLLCRQLVDLCGFLERVGSVTTPAKVIQSVSEHFGFDAPEDLPSLADRINSSIANLQLYINNPTHVPPPS